MNRVNPGCNTCLFALLACVATSAPALQVNGNVALKAQYTDNATLVPTNETDDIITTASISGTVSENEGRLTGNASASLRYLDYLDNTFDAQQYLQLATAARWQQISNVLSWNFNDYYAQASVNNLAGDTPANTEDINAASLGAQLVLRPADRHTVTLSPSFTDYYYELSGNDNQQSRISANWSYQVRPTWSMSVSGGYRDVTYDSAALNADYHATTLSLGLSTHRARSDYSASVGTTKVKRDSGSDTDGFNARLAAGYKLSERSSVNANLSSDLTDTSNVFLSSSIDPNTGSFGNVQISSDVVRDSVARVIYSRSGATVNYSVWTELRKLDYKASANDRDVQEVGATFGYGLSPRLTASVNGSYVRTKEENPAVTDKYSLAGGQLNYNLTSKMNAYTGVRFQNRDSTAAGAGYDEYSVFAGIGYRLGR